MTLRCPTCGSKDLWLPRREKTTFDRWLEKFGYRRFDCRGCWRRPILRTRGQWKSRSTELPAAVEAEPQEAIRIEAAPPPVKVAPAPLPIAPPVVVAAKPEPPPKPAPRVEPRIEPNIELPTLAPSLACSTIIGATMSIEGDISTREGIRVLGNVKGAIRAAGVPIVIEKDASVTANVEASDVVVRGRLQGDTVATGSITVSSGGFLVGEARTARLIIEDGASVKARNETGLQAKRNEAPVVKPDVVKTEAAKTEAVKIEPVQPEQVPEPVQLETPVRIEAPFELKAPIPEPPKPVAKPQPVAAQSPNNKKSPNRGQSRSARAKRA